jgi:hypothetical protein
LTVNGTGFVPGSVVNWNRSARTTTFVSGSQATASISAADVAGPGTASITITNPAPAGGTSNALSFSITSAKESLSFAAAPTYISGGVGIVAADLNNDGKMDVASIGPNDAFIQIGNGDGTFQAPISYSAGPPGQNCDYIAVADVNADGFLDVLVLDAETRSLSVLINNGDGTLQPAVLYSTSAISPLASFAVGDFNGDGALDIVVPDVDEGRVLVMLGTGNGTFQSAQATNCCFTPLWIGVGDFNGDGKLDLIVIDEFLFETYVLLGAGDGTFTRQVSTFIPNALYKVVIGDFNGDGKLDIASITYIFTLLPEMSVLLGIGDGTFQQPVQYSVGRFPTGLALADIDGDGKLDIVVGNSQDSTMSVLLGNGDGTFQTQQIVLAQNTGTAWIVAADFNGDGRLDLATQGTAFLQTNSLSLSAGSLSFPVQVVGTASSSHSVTVTNITGSSIQILGILGMGLFPRDFPETNDCPTSLGAGAQCTLNITFTPGAKNARSAFINIFDGTTSSEAIWLTGTGTVVSLSATQLDFGAQTVGTRSGAMSFTLTNKGARALALSGIVIAGANAPDFAEKNNCGSSVASGRACTVTAFFTPKATGHRSAYIRIDDNGGGSPQKVTFTGIGH